MVGGGRISEALTFVGKWSARVLEGLTDEEFFWEPVTGCWTIRPRRPDERVGSPTCVGRGDYALDDAPEDPDPAPFTTIAWRLGHVIMINRMFSNHLLGPGDLNFDDIEIPNSAEAAAEAWRNSYVEYADPLSAVTDLERDIEVPWGERKKQSLWHWTLVMLQENVHHLAEVGVVRDLFRQRG